MTNSCRGLLRDSYSPSGNFVILICLPTLEKVLDEVRTLLNSEFSVGLVSGTVTTLWNKSSAYHYSLVPWICVRVYRVVDTMFPPLLISSISDLLMLENSFSIVRNSCTSPPLSPWNPCAVWPMDLHYIDWCVCPPSLYTFNCSTRYLCLFSSCHLEPTIFQSFCLCLKVWPFIVIIISLNSEITAVR